MQKAQLIHQFTLGSLMRKCRDLINRVKTDQIKQNRNKIKIMHFSCAPFDTNYTELNQNNSRLWVFDAIRNKIPKKRRKRKESYLKCRWLAAKRQWKQNGDREKMKKNWWFRFVWFLLWFHNVQPVDDIDRLISFFFCLRVFVRGNLRSACDKKSKQRRVNLPKDDSNEKGEIKNTIRTHASHRTR